MADKRNAKRNNRNNKNYDEDYNPRFKKQRKKVCPLCGDKNFVLDYKNADQLKKFINEDISENYGEVYDDELYGSVYLDLPNTEWRGKELIDRVDY